MTPVFQEHNRTQGFRMLRRIPIALTIFFLFATAMFASKNMGAVAVASVVSFYVVICSLGYLLYPVSRAVKFAKLNFPVWLYMGTNNRLWLWLVVLAIASSISCYRTKPEPKQAPPPPPEVVSEFSIPDPAPAASAADATKPDAEAEEPSAEDQEPEDEEPATIELTAEERKANAEFYENLRRLNRQRLANSSKGLGHVTDEELAVIQANAPSVRWRILDAKVFSSTMLWLLIPLYFPFAFFDEVKRGVTRAVRLWSTKAQTASKPLLLEAAANWVGVPFPATAASVASSAASSAATLSKTFVGQVAHEVFAEIVSNKLFHRR